MRPMKVVPLRLTPGADLRRALEAWMAGQQEQAGCVISAVGRKRLSFSLHLRGDRPAAGARSRAASGGPSPEQHRWQPLPRATGTDFPWVWGGRSIATPDRGWGALCVG